MPPSWALAWTGDEDAAEALAILVMRGCLNDEGLEVTLCWLRARSAAGGLDDIGLLALLDMVAGDLAEMRGEARPSLCPPDARELEDDQRREW